MERLNQKYIAIAAKYGVQLRIRQDAQPTADHAVRKLSEHTYEIFLNPAQFDEQEYEAYLTYHLRKLLLPRLCVETERLRIRRYQDTDRFDFFEFLNDRESCYLDGGFEPFDAMDDEYDAWMTEFGKEDTRYMIAEKETGKVVGTIHFREESDRAVETMEVGFCIVPSARRNGYAYEALHRCIDVILNELHLDMLLASAFPFNEGSLHLIQKLGFCKEGVEHKALYHPAYGPCDLVYYYKERNAESG